MATTLLEKALESVGGPEGYERLRKQFREDLAFINDNRDKLLEDYGESWIAVYESKIIAHGKGYNKVLSFIEGKDMPVGQIPIRYLTKRKVFALYIQR